jgi:hypothetical protein
LKGKHRYRLGKDEEAERPLFSRTALHSSATSLIDYTTKKELRIESALPKDMSIVLQKLRQYASLQKQG